MAGFIRPINLKTAEVIERSSLKYTILRPVWLTDKSVKDFELTRKGETFRGTETSRASIGRFVANVVADPGLYVNENLGIGQPVPMGTDRPLTAEITLSRSLPSWLGCCWSSPSGTCCGA